MGSNLNYCQVCGKWLGPDDYDGICVDCDDEDFDDTDYNYFEEEDDYEEDDTLGDF